MYTITSSDAQKFVTSDFIPVETNDDVSAAAVTASNAIESLAITAGSGYTDGTYYAAVHGDGDNAGTASGAIVRITVSGGQIQSFGLTAGTDTTIHSAGTNYTFGTVNLGAGFTFSDSGLSSASNMGGSGGAVNVIISPNGGHGFDAVAELGGHFVMTTTTLAGGESDDFTTANDFRQIGLVVNPTNFGTATIASASTARQTFAVVFPSGTGDFVIDEEINQASTNAVGKVVEWDSSNRILFYQQERFSDFGTHTDGSAPAFSGANAITGQTSGTTRTPDTTASSVTFGSTTITLTSGYANPELQPDSGNIIYLEQRRPISRNTDQSEDIRLIIEF